MKRSVHLIIIFCLSIIFFAGDVCAAMLNNVVIISIDALHPEALLQANIPNLKKLMDDGAYTLNGRSTDPPKTLIAHTAMFTGLSPGENGKVDNGWVPGQTTVKKETIFDIARRHGFKTGYFYSKEKLGYLVNSAVDVHEWSQDYAADSAEAFIKTPGRHFTFLHVSGLDQVGPEFGWLSPAYLEELSLIDDYLSSMIGSIINQKHFVIIITSDHAGHEKIHGSDHPKDSLLPFIIYSDTIPVQEFQDMQYSVVNLKRIVEDFLYSS